MKECDIDVRKILHRMTQQEMTMDDLLTLVDEDRKVLSLLVSVEEIEDQRH